MTNLNLASFGKRFLAFIIDCIIVLILSYILQGIILKPYGGIAGAMGIKDYQFGEDIVKGAFTAVGAVGVVFLILLGTLFFAFLYDFLMTASPKQGTFGKVLMKIKVVKTTGESLNIFEALFRTIVKFVSGGFLLFLWLICLFTDKNQNIHDIFVKSVVVNAE